LAIIDKRRTGDDEKAIATNLIGDVSGKRCILVDDEIATGGTILEATEILFAHGAREVEVVAVHPVLSGPAVERLANSRISRITVSDTLPIPEHKRAFPGFGSKLTVLSVASLIADAISRIHDGRSVSQIFR
jgi:ribose-phosphate pyrophosphokinase